MNTIQIQYFANRSGIQWAAVALGRYVESICFYDERSYGAARIDLTMNGSVNSVLYERVENGYSPCSYDAYMEARTNALTGLIQFFGDSEEFTTPSTRPLYVDRPNCQRMVNDLPF